MHRRRRNTSLSTPMILVLILGVILLLIFSQLNINISVNSILALVTFFSLLLFVTGSVFVFWTNKLKRERLRAIQISQVDKMGGIEFEHYVGELLRFRRYKVEFTSVSHDYGVDILAHKERVRTAVQLKRYSENVGRAAISDVVAGMAHYKCTQAMVITSYYFTKEAKELAVNNKCILIDRDKLSSWIYNFQRGK